MISISNVSVTVNAGNHTKPILKDISVSVKPGRLVSILGHNGSGKSTLLKAIAGYIALKTGSIQVRHQCITPLPAFKRSDFIGYVQQYPQLGTAGQCTAAENICLTLQAPSMFRRIFTKKNMATATSILKNAPLNLYNIRHTLTSQLSGGQRQLLAILMILQKKPAVLLLDEITAALDPNTSEKVIASTYNHIKASQTTTLCVTHNLAHAILYSDRILIMREGKIACDLTSTQIKTLKVGNLAELIEHPA